MVSSWTALYLAYTIVWLGVFMYLIYMHLRQYKIEKDIENLKGQVSKDAE